MPGMPGMPGSANFHVSFLSIFDKHRPNYIQGNVYSGAGYRTTTDNLSEGEFSGSSARTTTDNVLASDFSDNGQGGGGGGGGGSGGGVGVGGEEAAHARAVLAHAHIPAANVLSGPSTVPRMTPSIQENCWSEPPAALFSVRGHHYLKGQWLPRATLCPSP